jgi:restriction endonuclease
MPNMIRSLGCGSDTISNMDPYEMMNEQWLYDNMIQVQKENNLLEVMYLNFDDDFELLYVNAWRYPYFTVEMVTGRGKTYSYFIIIY